MPNNKKLKTNFRKHPECFPDGKPKKKQYTDDLITLLHDGNKVEDLQLDIFRALMKTANEDLHSLGHRTQIKSKSFEMGPHKESCNDNEQGEPFEGNPASINRLYDKADTKYEGHFSGILDYRRSRINLNSPTQIAALCSVMEWCEQYDVELPHGAVIIDTDNRFKYPSNTGHSMYAANIAIPIPNKPDKYHIVEMVITHEGFEKSIKADESHETYEKERKLRKRAQTDKPLNEDAGKYWTKIIRTARNLHNRWRKHYKLDEIPFEKFERLRGRTAQEDFDNALKNEQSND